MSIVTKPSLELANTPTAVERLGSLSEAVGADLFVKRDDQTAGVAQGNKVRKLEYLLADAQESSADTVVTAGGTQSNHCRATAITARRAGLEPYLLLHGEEPETADGNLLLNELVGATIEYISDEAYYDRREQTFAEVVERLENQGRRPYRIPPGGSNGIGILGYVRAYEEIRAFTADTRTDFDRIYLAGGSGGTHAGLLAGIQHFGDDTAVVGVNVTPYDDVEMRRKILRNVHQANDELDVDLEEIETRIDIRSGYLGPGYATPSEDDLRTIVEVGSKEGLVLDTCYTAKAFRCFLEEAEPGATNLFVHTGGSYGLFPLREQVRRAVAKFGSSEGDESSTF